MPPGTSDGTIPAEDIHVGKTVQDMHAIVHIGAPKAGSSSIQNTIRLNREVLTHQGLFCFWPENGPYDLALAARFVKNFKKLPPMAQHQLGSLESAHAWSGKCWADLEEQVRARRPELTLISSEFLFGMPQPKAFVDALRSLFSRITLVLYVRDPVSQYVSQLDQQIRGGARFQDLQSPLHFKYYGYSCVTDYAEILGTDNIVVRNFERSNLLGGDVVTDFFDVAGRLAGRPAKLERIPSRANESLVAAASIWLMTVNEAYDRFGKNAPSTVKRRRELIDRFRQSADLGHLPKLKMTDEVLIALIRNNAREVCTWYNDTFLQGQMLLQVAPLETAPPSEGEVRARMRDWLFGYLTPESLAPVLRAAVPLTEGEAHH